MTDSVLRSVTVKKTFFGKTAPEKPLGEGEKLHEIDGCCVAVQERALPVRLAFPKAFEDAGGEPYDLMLDGTFHVDDPAVAWRRLGGIDVSGRRVEDFLTHLLRFGVNDLCKPYAAVADVRGKVTPGLWAEKARHWLAGTGISVTVTAVNWSNAKQEIADEYAERLERNQLDAAFQKEISDREHELALAALGQQKDVAEKALEVARLERATVEEKRASIRNEQVENARLEAACRKEIEEKELELERMRREGERRERIEEQVEAIEKKRRDLAFQTEVSKAEHEHQKTMLSRQQELEDMERDLTRMRQENTAQERIADFIEAVEEKRCEVAYQMEISKAEHEHQKALLNQQREIVEMQFDVARLRRDNAKQERIDACTGAIEQKWHEVELEKMELERLRLWREHAKQERIAELTEMLEEKRREVDVEKMELDLAHLKRENAKQELIDECAKELEKKRHEVELEKKELELVRLRRDNAKQERIDACTEALERKRREVACQTEISKAEYEHEWGTLSQRMEIEKKEQELARLKRDNAKQERIDACAEALERKRREVVCQTEISKAEHEHERVTLSQRVEIEKTRLELARLQRENAKQEAIDACATELEKKRHEVEVEKIALELDRLRREREALNGTYDDRALVRDGGGETARETARTGDAAPVPLFGLFTAHAKKAGGLEMEKQNFGTRDIGVRRVQVNTLNIGESLSFTIQSDRSGYATILNFGTSGKVWLLAPGCCAGDTRVAARTLYKVPGSGLFAPEWEFTEEGPTGREHLVAIVTDRPLAAVERAAARSTHNSPLVELCADERKELYEEVSRHKPGEWSVGVLSFLVEEAKR